MVRLFYVRLCELREDIKRIEHEKEKLTVLLERSHHDSYRLHSSSSSFFSPPENGILTGFSLSLSWNELETHEIEIQKERNVMGRGIGGGSLYRQALLKNAEEILNHSHSSLFVCNLDQFHEGQICGISCSVKNEVISKLENQMYHFIQLGNPKTSNQT
jgi:hypothetical protein